MNLNQLPHTQTTFRSSSFYYSNNENNLLIGFQGDYQVNNGKLDILNFTNNNIDQVNLPINGLNINDYLEFTEISIIQYMNNGKLIGYGPSSTNNSKFLNFAIFPEDLELNKKLNIEGPGSRIGNTIGSSSNGTIFSFGGFEFGNNKPSQSYFHAFNIASNEWKDITNQTLYYGIPRLAYNTLTNINNNYLISIGGGIVNGEGLLNDNPFNLAYIFDLKSSNWKTQGLLNCPSETRIGHSATLLNNELIIIGGTNNTSDKLSLLTSSYSIDLTNFNCKKLNIKLETDQLTNIEKAFHGASLIDNYIIINQGWPIDEIPIVLDTATWTRQSKFKNLNLPQFSSNNQIYSNSPPSQKSIIIWSVVGALIITIICFIIYFCWSYRNKKKKWVNSNTQRFYNIDNNIKPIDNNISNSSSNNNTIVLESNSSSNSN